MMCRLPSRFALAGYTCWGNGSEGLTETKDHGTSKIENMKSSGSGLIQAAALVVVLLASTVSALAQTHSQKAAVPLTATVQSSPARITLSWTTLPSTTSITIYRKLVDATTWGSAIATPAASALSYADNTVAVGTQYEYRVVRVAGGVTSQGYIASGIAVPPVDFRGRMILLVDNTFSSSLSNELATLVTDLRADGWAVVRTDLARTTPLATVKSTIVGHYNADPANTKALFIVGHLAVPYSGNQAPDGHDEHSGAWPCDGYYGELNGTWTDNTVNNGGTQRPANANVPGDGKFDQSNFPNAVELQVGRVDLFDMPAFSLSETELTRAYLNKLHNYKVKQWTPIQRGMMFDNFQYLGYPLAASGWRSMAPLVGTANITIANQVAYPMSNLVNNNSYLWTYGCGGGSQQTVNGVLTYNGAANVGTTQEYASTNMNGVFNMSFGSYFGDWDNKNNFLRAPLCSGQALTSVWSAIPGWYFHHMGMGANIGYSTLVTMNNSSLYTPLHDGWQGSIGRCHLGLMGDPSLRQKMVAPPSSLVVGNSNGFASFTWAASAEAVDGYHLYSINAATGVITRITTSLLPGTSHTSTTVPFTAGQSYMVRAVKLTVEPSGSYYNLSLGATATASGSAVDCNGVIGGPAQPGAACNDGNSCTVNDALNASCQCVGTSTAPAAAITVGGSTIFCSGGAVLLSTSTGTGYTYQWRRNGANLSGATSATYSATLAGNYSVVVTSGSCGSTSSEVTVTVNSLPSTTVTAAGPTTFCSGGSVLLSAPTGSGLTYQWRNNGAWIIGANSSTYTASTTAQYSVTVTNGSGCSATSSSVYVTTTTAPAATITAGGSTSFCSGGSVMLSANTGTGLTHQWKRNGTNISGATSSSYAATLAGSYTVVVSNGGCSTTSTATTVTVGGSTTATITAGGATTFCSGGSVTLSANTGTGLSYQWRRNGTNLSGATASTYAATTTGTYTVVVTSSGCSTTSAGTNVTVNTSPSATITAGGPTSFCTGGNVVLSGNTGSGLTYQWRRNGTNISGATSNSHTATLAGSYTLVVSNGGCSTTSAATTVAIGSAPTATISAGGATTFCSGGSVTLSANTGTGFSYQWRRNGTNLSGATASTYAATTTGTYTVVVTSSGCSTTSAGTNVTANTSPTATITAGGSTSFCTGGSVVLSANTGTGLTYQWRNNGNNISGATASTYTATGSGSYTVVVSNGTCSTTSAATTVATGSAPAATISAGGATAFCSGGSVTLSANTGTGLTYQWRRNGTSISGATGSTHAATLSGTYTVLVTSNGCSTVSSGITVTVSAAPAASISYNGSSALCNGATLTLSANIGSGLTYQWRRNGTNISGATSSAYNASLAGTYTVVVGNGTCSATSNAVSLTTGSGPTVSCSSNASTSTVSVTATGGQSPYTYSWSTSPSQSSATATVSASGTYSVTVTGANGCSSSCSSTITLSASTGACSGLRTEAQGTWGANATQWNVAGLMTTNWSAAFPTGITIGCGSRTMRFTSAQAVINTLPNYGTPSLLPVGVTTNPGSTVQNTIVGQIVSLTLNIRMDELLPSFAPSNLLLKNMVVASGTFAGLTAQQLLNLANQHVGGCAATYPLSTISQAVTNLNNGYQSAAMNNGFLTCPPQMMMLEQGDSAFQDGEARMQVYPNPTRSSTLIMLPALEVGTDLRVTILSATGAEVAVIANGSAEAGIGKRIEWDASDLPAGLYICVAQLGPLRLHERIIVE